MNQPEYEKEVSALFCQKCREDFPHRKEECTVEDGLRCRINFIIKKALSQERERIRGELSKLEKRVVLNVPCWHEEDVLRILEEK